jgi:hypothetical protein
MSLGEPQVSLCALLELRCVLSARIVDLGPAIELQSPSQEVRSNETSTPRLPVDGQIVRSLGLLSEFTNSMSQNR